MNILLYDPITKNGFTAVNPIKKSHFSKKQIYKQDKDDFYNMT